MVCSQCKIDKDPSAFRRHKTFCRDCEYVSNRARYHANKEKELERIKAYQSTEKGKEVGKLAVSNYKKKYSRQRANAHACVYRALKSRKIVRPDKCSACGTISKVGPLS